MVNVVIVVMNITFGLLANLTSFTTQYTLSHTPRSTAENVSQLPKGHSPATFPSTSQGLTVASGNFTYHGFLWAGKAWEEISKDAEICLATHSSPDRLHTLELHARSFLGPISVAVFASGSDFVVAAEMITYLRQCVDGLEDRVSFHLVHPYSDPPRPSRPSVRDMKCDDAEEFNRELVSAAGLKPYLGYPQNILRNLARNGCHANYTLNIDMDMLVPPYMYPRLSGFLSGRSCPRCAYVVPVYETRSGLPAPETKSDLLKLISLGDARIYHIQVYKRNQGNSHLHLWEKMGQPNHPPYFPYTILYNITTYMEQWEPILVLPRGAPSFDERFIGYGFTRSSQVYELHLRKFRFSVLDEAFLIHLGFQDTSGYPESRRAQIKINRVRYQMFKKELHARLGHPQPPPLTQQEREDVRRLRFYRPHPRLFLNARKRER